MPLVGTLSTMSLPDLLQWLGTARQTGTLQVERSKVVKWILFRDGRVIGCSSDDPPERLGQFLLSRGKITEDQLREALRLQGERRRHLGMILVGMGVLTEEDLRELLAAKSEETIYSIFDWPDALFRFEEKLADVENVLPVSLQVEDILLRGLRRFDEMRLIREVISDPGIILRQTPRLPPPGVFHNKMARQIYESVDGGRTVAEILLIAHGSEYLVSKFLYELERAGYLEVVGLRNTEPEPVAEPVLTARRVAASPHVPSREAPPEPEPTAAPGARAEPETGPETATEAGPPAAEAGVATAGGATEAPPTDDDTSLETDLAAARGLMAQGDYDAALQLLDRLYRACPEDDSLRKLTAEAEAAFTDKAYKHYLPGDHLPVLTRPVDELERENLSPTEFYLLSRVDGTWDVRSIIQITPLREVEALQTLKRMRDKGIIDLEAPAE